MICQRCKGDGIIIHVPHYAGEEFSEEKCEACNGSGEVFEDEEWTEVEDWEDEPEEEEDETEEG